MSINKAEVRVLFVDDDPVSRKLNGELVLRRLLGYPNIETAANGSEALTLAERYKPHLVLMDTRMPDSLGYEVCRQMRQEYYGKDIAIGGMSNIDDSTIPGLWTEYGADFYFKKDLFTSKEGQHDLDKRIQEALVKYQQG